jgi:hypothetical protein
MAYRIISRRHFIEESITGSLAFGLGSGCGPLGAVASAITPGTDGMTIKVTGDAKQGYGVALLFNGQPFAQHNRGGEFSASFKNEERSVEDRVNNSRATTLPCSRTWTMN